MSEKLHFGLLCNHIHTVQLPDTVYCTECSDGVVDVCIDCFKKASRINDIENNPFNGVTDYWFAGTMKELVVYIHSI